MTPVYKVKKIRETIKLALNQTFASFESWVINNGSYMNSDLNLDSPIPYGCASKE